MEPSAVTSESSTMSSSPFSSPHHGSQHPEELTPRSKVRALLAPIDSDSEQETPNDPLLHNQKRQALAPVTGNRQISKTLRAKSPGGDHLQQDDSEEDAILPRSSVAARSNTETTERRVSNSDQNGSGTEDAYARIKRKLMVDRKQFEGDDATSAKAGFEKTVSGSYSQGISPSRQSRHVSPASPTTQERCSSEGKDSTNASVTAVQRGVGEPGPSEASGPNSRFQELVAKKRAEREAKEAEEERARVEKRAKERDFERTLSQDASASDDVLDDDLGEKHLTQTARPTRKASKKAIEEMTRETQRMNRNMQLAHQARTKKKISKDSLFARFNFRTEAPPPPTNLGISEHQSSSTIPSSAPASDAEVAPSKESPLTSPASSVEHLLGKSILASARPNIAKNTAPANTQIMTTVVDEDLPEFADIINQCTSSDKGKNVAKATEKSIASVSKKNEFSFKQRPVRVSLPTTLATVGSVDLDSDSDLELQPGPKRDGSDSKTSKLDAFSRVPADKRREGKSLLTLRALAHINSPDERLRSGRPSVNMADMQMSLQKRARLQALEERKAKIDDLRARGILIQTTEEREKDQAEVEDLLEKARREAEEIQQKEKKAAKKAKVASGEVDALDSSDDDGDYADDEDHETVDDLSGSEEEDDIAMADTKGMSSEESELESEKSEEEENSDTEDRSPNLFVDAQAEDAGEEGERNQTEESEEDGGADVLANDSVEDDGLVIQLPRTRRNRIAIEDDEEDDPITEDKSSAGQIEVDAKKIPETPAINVQIPPIFETTTEAAGISLGMTQAFAATMAETQGELLNESESQEDSMEFMGPPPEPNIPLFAAQDSLQLIPDSQDGMTEIQDTVHSHQINLQFSQSQLQHDTLGATQLQRELTEISEIPDATQDAGFTLSSPVPERFVTEPPSTVDTLILTRAESMNDEPRAEKKRGRLVRRVVDQPDSNKDKLNANDIHSIPRDAFRAMKEKRKRRADAEAFNKKKSEAKEMVEEQAAESEDEYAGLGGASDDESGGEEDENIKAMMENGEVEVDEGQLAALHADKERASDGKFVQKLFRDLNNGNLRRKRGADLDLSDSEDDVEARRRQKQRDFAKMRKALLADEKVGQIAEDPKKLAFLRAIEDRENDEDLDFLDQPAEESFQVEMDTQEDNNGEAGHSESQRPIPQVLATQDNNSNNQTRPLLETDPNMRPPATSRRTAAKTTLPSIRKPSTLAEIRDSVSFLVEAPGVTIADTSSASEPEDNADNDNISHSNTRRRNSFVPKSTPIIDRLLLKRASTTSSNSSSTSASTRSRLAFHDPSSSGGSTSLLLQRRHTLVSTSAFTSADKNGISTYAPTERATAGGHDDNNSSSVGLKAAGRGKMKSSVNCFAREMERQGARVVANVERRRREEREKKGRERRGGKGGGLGGLVGQAGFD